MNEVQTTAIRTALEELEHNIRIYEDKRQRAMKEYRDASEVWVTLNKRRMELVDGIDLSKLEENAADYNFKLTEVENGKTKS
jgi:accessory colonization factor AcfC